MKSFLKVVISMIVLIALLTGSYFVSFNLFKEESDSINAMDVTISSTDPECYFIKKAPVDIAFELKTSSTYGYTLTDFAENTVKASEEKTDSTLLVNPPSGNYKKGETYIITLAEGTSFVDEDISKARKVIFTIEENKTEHYVFNDTVKETDTTLKLDSEGRLILPTDSTYSAGDIIFGKSVEQDKYEAYKIVSVSGNTATIEIPALDEIYKELEIYNDYEFDVDYISDESAMELEVIDNLVSSDFYNDVISVAYGGEYSSGAEYISENSLSVEDYEFSLKKDEEENSVSFSLTIPLKPAEGGVFGFKDLKNHSVNLNLSNTIKCDSFVDFDSAKEWTTSYTVTSDFSWSIEVNMLSYEYEDDPDMDELFEGTKLGDNYHKKVEKISEKLQQLTEDKKGWEVSLFEWEIPIAAIPGLIFETEIEAFIGFEARADLVIGNTYNMKYSCDLSCRDGEFYSSSNEFTCDSSPSMSLRGMLGARVGIQLEIQLCFIDEDIAHIGVTPQAGAYADVYALAPILGAEDFDGDPGLYAYMETGAYVQISLDAYINLLITDLTFGPMTFEKKWAIPEGGYGNSEIVLGVDTSEATVIARNGKAAVPDLILKYYDVVEGIKSTRFLSTDEYEIYDSDNNKVETSGREISVPDVSEGNDKKFRASFIHENGHTYDTEFTVTASSSVIEGKVSAFNKGRPVALEGAVVSLYKHEDTDDSVAAKVTGDDGVFKFNVTPGTYKLRISANGYQTLVTTQTVDENETKYTEHLLLIDENQDGLGSSKGTISDALNGQGVSGATIKLRKEWNNTSGDYVSGFSTQTDSSGCYTITDLPIGYYTIEAAKTKYITSYCNILVLDDKDLVAFDFAMTPQIEEGTVRIILNWGASPSDLDSHLVGTGPDGYPFRVYYADSEYYYNGTEMVNLDHDDTSSYGPETITILEDINGTYTYEVHDYTNGSSSSSNALSYSGARIRVLIGGRNTVEEFYVPINRVGTYWTVFKIDSNYNITPVNTISNRSAQQ